MHDSGDDVPCCASCCARLLLIGVALTCVLVPAYGVVYPVRATVRDASVSRLALTNGTALEYDVSLTVALRNRNWAMRAEHASPLYADLLFAGRLLERAELADMVAGGSGRVDPLSTQEFRLRAVSTPPWGIELSGDEVAEFARGTVGGFAEFELRLVGAFEYRPVHVGGAREMNVRCPLKFPVAVATPPTTSVEAAAVGTHFMSTVFDKISIRCY